MKTEPAVIDGELLFQPEDRKDRKVHQTRQRAKADVFDYVERFYNPYQRHSTIEYVSAAEYEKTAALA